MKLLYLRCYSNGYTGFVEEKHHYVFFKFPRKGEIKKLLKYNKTDYNNYRHFIIGISRFFPYNLFLQEPVDLESLTIAELDRIFNIHYKYPAASPDPKDKGVAMKKYSRRGFLNHGLALTAGVIFFPVISSCNSYDDSDPLSVPLTKPDNWDAVGFNRARGNAGAIPKTYLDDINGPDGETKHIGKHLPYIPDIDRSLVPRGFIAIMWGDQSKGYSPHPNAPPNKPSRYEGHWYNWIEIRKATNLYAKTSKNTYSSWPATGSSDSGSYLVYGGGDITSEKGTKTICLALLPPDVSSGDTVRIRAHCLTHGEYVDFIQLRG